MATYVDIVQEDVYAEQAVFVGRLKQVLATTLLISAVAFAGQSNVVSEAFAATSEAFAPNQLIIEESAVVRSAVFSSTHGNNTVLETAQVQSGITDSLAELTESAQISDSIFSRYQNILSEPATVTSAVFTTSSPDNVLTESVQISGVAFQPLSNVVLDEITAGSSVFSSTSSSATLTDEATISGGVIDLVVTNADVLASAAAISSSLWAESHGRTVVIDRAWIEGSLWSPEPAPTQAWAASTDTFAMSRFVGPEQHSRHRDVLVGPAGVSRPAPEEFEVSLVTGMHDFKDVQIKRVPYAYVGVSGEAAEVVVHETDTGSETEYVYPVETRQADAARPTRAVIGRGLRSRYWRFGIRGVQGLKVLTFNLDVLDSNRRI